MKLLNKKFSQVDNEKTGLIELRCFNNSANAIQLEMFNALRTFAIVSNNNFNPIGTGFLPTPVTSVNQWLRVAQAYKGTIGFDSWGNLLIFSDDGLSSAGIAPLNVTSSATKSYRVILKTNETRKFILKDARLSLTEGNPGIQFNNPWTVRKYNIFGKYFDVRTIEPIKYIKPEDRSNTTLDMENVNIKIDSDTGIYFQLEGNTTLNISFIAEII